MFTYKKQACGDNCSKAHKHTSSNSVEDWRVSILSSHRRALNRQVTEAISISNEGVNILNSKMELTSPRFPSGKGPQWWDLGREAETMKTNNNSSKVISSKGNNNSTNMVNINKIYESWWGLRTRETEQGEEARWRESQGSVWRWRRVEACESSYIDLIFFQKNATRYSSSNRDCQ